MKPKWCIAAFLVVLVFGCATVAVHPAPGTVLEKFVRMQYAEGHSELAINGGWVNIPILHTVIHWVRIQADGFIIERPMTLEDWHKIKVGDVIAIMDDGSPGSGGGT